MLGAMPHSRLRVENSLREDDHHVARLGRLAVPHLEGRSSSTCFHRGGFLDQDDVRAAVPVLQRMGAPLASVPMRRFSVLQEIQVESAS